MYPGNLEFARVPNIVRIYKVAPSLCLGFLHSTVYAEDLLLFWGCTVWVCAGHKWLSQLALIKDLANQSLAISPCKACESSMVSITTDTRGTVWVLGTSSRRRLLEACAFSSSGFYHIHVSSFLNFLCLLTIINYSHENNCMLSLASFSIYQTWRRSGRCQGIWETYFQEFGEEEIQFLFNLSEIQLTKHVLVSTMMTACNMLKSTLKWKSTDIGIKMFAQIHRDLLNYSSIIKWNYKLAFKRSEFEKIRQNYWEIKKIKIIKEQN